MNESSAQPEQRQAAEHIQIVSVMVELAMQQERDQDLTTATERIKCLLWEEKKSVVKASILLLDLVSFLNTMIILLRENDQALKYGMDITALRQCLSIIKTQSTLFRRNKHECNDMNIQKYILETKDCMQVIILLEDLSKKLETDIHFIMLWTRAVLRSGRK